MLRVPVYSGVLKLKNVNKKGLRWQAKIARHRFAHGKALSCCCCRYTKTCKVENWTEVGEPISYKRAFKYITLKFPYCILG